MKKAIGGILAAVIAGVLTWWIIEKIKDGESGGPPSSAVIPDTPPPVHMAEQEPNINRDGGDYKDFVAGDITECLVACEKDSDCKAITYNKSSRQCWMKSSVPLRSDDSNYISSVKVIG